MSRKWMIQNKKLERKSTFDSLFYFLFSLLALLSLAEAMSANISSSENINFLEKFDLIYRFSYVINTILASL